MKSRICSFLLACAALGTTFAVSGCDADKDKGPRGTLVMALAGPPCGTEGIVFFIGNRQYGPIRPGDELDIRLDVGTYIVEATTLEGLSYPPSLVQITKGETEFIPFGCP